MAKFENLVAKFDNLEELKSFFTEGSGWEICEVALSNDEIDEIRSEYEIPNGYDADTAVEQELERVNKCYVEWGVPTDNDDVCVKLFKEYLEDLVGSGRAVFFDEFGFNSKDDEYGNPEVVVKRTVKVVFGDTEISVYSE